MVQSDQVLTSSKHKYVMIKTNTHKNNNRNTLVLNGVSFVESDFVVDDNNVVVVVGDELTIGVVDDDDGDDDVVEHSSIVHTSASLSSLASHGLPLQISGDFNARQQQQQHKNVKTKHILFDSSM
jgi:hypothetical protein